MGDQTLPIPLREMVFPPFQFFSGLPCEDHRCGIVLSQLHGGGLHHKSQEFDLLGGG